MAANILVTQSVFTSSPLQFLEDAFSDSPLNSGALQISLKSPNAKNILTLIDSSSSVSFLDSRFALQNNLKLSNLKTPLRLTLFDGTPASSGLIYQYTDLSVEFPCSTQHTIRFLITTLDQSTHAVLGYSWLHQKNPTIDWVTHKLTFRLSQSIALSGDALRSPPSRTIPELTTPPLASASAGSSTTSQTPDSATSADLRAAATKISISVINAAAARLLQRLPQSHPQSILFSGLIKPAALKANAATTNPAAPQFESSLTSEFADITSKVPSPYHEFTDV